MVVFDHEKIQLLVSQRRLSEAFAELAVSSGEVEPHLNDLRAGVCALAGDDRGLARIVAPELLGCRTADDVARLRETSDGAGPFADLAAGVVLAWSANADGAYTFLQQACDGAVSRRWFHVAVGARERLAHHALLFGDVEVARRELAEAIRLASERCLPEWLAHCLVAAARLSLDAGDLFESAQLLDRVLMQRRSPELLARCAPIGAQLAVENGDAAALRTWTSSEIVDAALQCAPDVAAAATTALLIATGAAKAEAPATVALRRALFTAGGAASGAELFSMAARYGDIGEARLGARALSAEFAPNRPYLRAHYLLARAYLSFRFGKRPKWTDHAGDAARSFSAMGLRRWTNEAMLLLVRQDRGSLRQAGQSGTSALTERERQVADLIRRGARNREVAIALQISEHTVERHVSSILGRLGLRSRWQIADTRRSEED